MNTIKDKLVQIKELKNDLVTNLNKIELDANNEESFNKLIPKIYKKHGGFAKLVLPWFNLAYYNGTEAQQILDSLTFSQPPTNFSYWCRELNDPTLVLDIIKFIDFTKQPKINYAFNGIICKELILRDADLSYVSSTRRINFIGNNAIINTFRIKNCIFDAMYSDFIFNSSSSTKVKLKEVYLEDITMTNDSPFSLLWGDSKSEGLEKLYIKNINLDKATRLRYIGTSSSSLKEFYCDNLNVNSVDSYQGIQEILGNTTAVENVTLLNCDINKIFNRSISSTHQTWRGIKSKNLKSFKINNVTITDNGDNSYKIYNLLPTNGTSTFFNKLEEFDISNWSGSITDLTNVTVPPNLIPTADVPVEDLTYIDFKMDNWDVSNVTNITRFCSALGRVKNLDTLKTLVGTAMIENASFAFYSFRGASNYHEGTIEEIDLTHFDFSNCTNMTEFCGQSDINGSSLYGNTTVKRIIGVIDCSNVKSTGTARAYGFATAFMGLNALESMPALINLGKGIDVTKTTETCSIDLHNSKNLTHETAVNLLNGLYDLNLVYDVANGGTLVTQKFKFNANVIAQLTPEEIAIATNKGWIVS